MQSKLTYALFATSCLIASSEVRLNELMASNTRAFPDIVDFDDYPDWFELHNPDDEDASLDGYFLSDDPTEPLKWPVPSGATVPANGYLVFIADGNDTAPGESFPRGYWPWRNFETDRYHTNFSLSASGEALVLSKALGGSSPTIFPIGSSWKYLDDGSSQGNQWKARTYDDSGWQEGPAPLGYGDDPATEVSFGDDDRDKHITTYFRKHFQIDDPSLLGSITITLQVDDSCVIYLNGNEIIRRNLPGGLIDSETVASSSTAPPEEAYYHTYTLAPNELLSGDNVFAVEVHQNGRTSVDLRFDLALETFQFDSLATIDSITYDQQVTDISLGRDPGTPENWVQFAHATPNGTNSSLVIPDIRFESGTVDIVPDAGFYATDQTISLSSDEGDIRYTLDGSTPVPSSMLYTGPFPVTTTTVVRARSYASGKVPGPILSRTFFFGESASTLPYVSLTADPETLFGDEIGIYLNDHEPSDDVYKGKDAPGHMEFFPIDGSEGFQANGGIRIGGENNWGSHDQKALNFILRGKYGDDAIKYDLFPGSGVPLYTGITLREGGDNYDEDMLRDSLWWYLAADDQVKVDTSARRPVVAFINGDYWGIYNIRERWDEQWFHEKHGIDDGNYDHVGFGHFTSSSTTLGAEHGSFEEWEDFYENFLDQEDLENPDNWAFVESRIDIDSYIDFVICESYGNNTSWRHNREFWKERKPGAKWRWFVPDMDRTFQTQNLDGNVFGSMLDNSDILDNLKENQQFEDRLAQRFAAHIGSTFHPARVTKIIDTVGPEIDAELDRYEDRWPDNTSREDYYDALDDIKEFAEQRGEIVIDRIRRELDLEDPVDLDLQVTGEGLIRLAGVKMPVGSLQVFPEILTELSAEPAPGFSFSHWTGADGLSATEVELSGSHTITAHFVADSSTAVSGTLSNNTTWTSIQSPYVVTEDIIVPLGVTLAIRAGVEVQVLPGRHIRVMGTLDINGTKQSKVTFRGRFGGSWGGLSFEEPITTSTLQHLVIRDATRGKEPTLYPAAISGLNATLEMDFIDIAESRGPLFFRGGSMILRDSLLHIPVTGDGLNVKQGQAQTIRCTFLGNNSPDTDAIDYDGVINGLIKDCRIYRFLGFNSDGIDTGERCVNVLIEGNTIFYNSDKGISVGQGSSVILRKNLIVGCPLGVGVKDSGSFILVDQNTFVDCGEGVSVYEKNFGSGGGQATVTNNIFSNCPLPVTFDALSGVTSNYNLSDTISISGSGNLFSNPAFTNSSPHDYTLTPASPAVDSGDPDHATDPDGTRVDMGAAYHFDPEDYPFEDQTTVVINEILANSGSEADWIELYNRSDKEIDISGWFLSDDGSNLSKYRIADGTILPAKSYFVLYEDLNFGSGSVDPNLITPFALSNTGETVHLTSAVNNELTEYRFSEKFAASFVGVTQGFYYKPGTDSYNFVALSEPTLAFQNAPPKVGPIVISEIMSSPAGSGSGEYFELLNIADTEVTLFDDPSATSWRFSSGIEFEFPSAAPITMAPGERLIFTRNLTAFQNQFSAPADTRIIEWLSGKLNNSGEALQLDQPGPVDEFGNVHFVRVDRVNYSHDAPWPTGADESGFALAKIAEHSYGNDPTNWQVLSPSPGAYSSAAGQFDDWAAALGNLKPLEDEDLDGHSNLAEYAMGSDPFVFDLNPLFTADLGRDWITLALPIDTSKTDVDVIMEHSIDLLRWEAMSLPPVSKSEGIQFNEITFPRTRSDDYFRIRVVRKP